MSGVNNINSHPITSPSNSCPNSPRPAHNGTPFQTVQDTLERGAEKLTRAASDTSLEDTVPVESGWLRRSWEAISNKIAAGSNQFVQGFRLFANTVVSLFESVATYVSSRFNKAQQKASAAADQEIDATK